MADKSSIEWTDATWNFVDGCDQISPGCAHCYAKTFAARGLGHFAGGRPFENVRMHEDTLMLPFRWRRPRRVFVVSMGDPFHHDVSDTLLDRAHAVMALADGHIFQVLTKRDERMLAYYTAPDLRARIAYRLAEFAAAGYVTLERGAAVSQSLTDLSGWPLTNVWVGVSVENQRFADERIPRLLETPAAVRWISAEPLLERIDLDAYLYWACRAPKQVHDAYACVETRGLDWVVVGGESGRGARPFHIEWARSLRDQCREAGVAFFLKQLGAFPRFDRDEFDLFLRDRKGGDPAEWPEDLRVREYPRVEVLASTT